MYLTLFTDYAFRTLVYLALQREGLCTIREIAEAYGISRNHLMKVVNTLVRLGYVEAVRGVNGGIRLGRPPEAIMLGELVRRTESERGIVECFCAGNQCAITASCRLTGVLQQALGAFMGVLDQYRLSDLLPDLSRQQQPLGRIQPLVFVAPGELR